MCAVTYFRCENMIFSLFQDEVIEFAVLPYLNSIHEEKDPAVRLVAAQLLVDLVMTCSSARCTDILSVLGKVGIELSLKF